MRKKISDYTGSKVGNDWMPSVLAAYAALGTGGGTIEFDTDTELKSAINFNTSGDVSMKLVGDGSLQYVNADSSVQLIRSSNQTDFLMDGLNVRGKKIADGTTADCNLLVLSNAYDRSIVEKSSFAGIKAASCLFYFYQTDARIIDSSFGGSYGTSDGNVFADGCSGLTVKDSHFYDYRQMKDGYYDFVGGPSWLKARNAPASTSAFTPLIHIVRSRFDEGSPFALDSDSYPHVVIEHCRVNVNGTNQGAGFKIANAQKVVIKNTWLGLGTVDNRRAVSLNNVELAEMSDLTLSHGVKKIELLGTTKKVILRNCRYDYNGTKYPLTLANITNTANAIVEIDGVTFRGGKTAFV